MTKARDADSPYRRVITVGIRMSNVLYNLAQGVDPTARERDQFRLLCRSWDAALSDLRLQRSAAAQQANRTRKSTEGKKR
jgi:hypothetical protein